MTDKPSIIATAAALNCLPTKQTGNKLVSGDCPAGHGSDGNRCFFVYPDTESFYCWHCQAGGSAYDLIMLALKCEFKEAVAWARDKGLVAGESPVDSKALEVFRLLTATARGFNRNLDSFYREYLNVHYGLTQDTVDQYAIGFAPTNGKLIEWLKKHYSDELIDSSGLVSYGKPFFQGQLIFPYWKDGLVRYMIGRKTQDSLPNKGKYEKLKTTDVVKNDVFYGEDSIKNCQEIYLTEGVTDCLAALQYKLPSISPVTTQFRKADHPKLSQLSKGKTVYLIPDNEENHAGMDGATATLAYLTEQGIKAYVLTLPRPEGQEKIDFNEYVRDNGIAEFLKLRDEQVAVADAGAIEYIRSDVEEWLDLQGNGVFTISELYREIGLTDASQRVARRAILKDLVTKKIIKRDESKPGIYSRVNNEENVIDWINADPNNIYDIRWPLDLHKYASLYPKNIAVVAGSTNTGKSALLLNLALLNLGTHAIKYFSSEMAAEELHNRLSNFGCAINCFSKIKFIDRSTDFAPLIQPDALNIIDFMEISDNFYAIGGEIRTIYDALTTGICVIAIQKKRGATTGRGGDFTMEKARLYITLDNKDNQNILAIRKAKIWAQPGINPNGKEIRFSLVNGCRFQECL